MKHIGTVIVLLLFPLSRLFSQQIHFGIGPSVSFGNYKGLNFVIDRYNATRQGQNGAATLSREMKNMHVFTGINWKLGFYLPVAHDGGFYFGITRMGRGAYTWAEGKDVNGNTIRRDLKFSANSVNVDFGLAFGEKGKTLVIVGFSPDFINYRASTKVGNGSYTKVMKELAVGFSPLLDINIALDEIVSLGIRPSYQFVPVKTSYYDLNKAINPATYLNDADDNTTSRGNNFSLQVMLNVMLGDK